MRVAITNSVTRCVTPSMRFGLSRTQRISSSPKSAPSRHLRSLFHTCSNSMSFVSFWQIACTQEDANTGTSRNHMSIQPMAHHSPSGYQASRIMIEVEPAGRSLSANGVGIGHSFAKAPWFAQERQIGLSRTCICQMEKQCYAIGGI
jgi:hypothetical protein